MGLEKKATLKKRALLCVALFAFCTPIIAHVKPKKGCAVFGELATQAPTADKQRHNGSVLVEDHDGASKISLENKVKEKGSLLATGKQMGARDDRIDFSLYLYRGKRYMILNRFGNDPIQPIDTALIEGVKRKMVHDSNLGLPVAVLYTDDGKLFLPYGIQLQAHAAHNFYKDKGIELESQEARISYIFPSGKQLSQAIVVSETADGRYLLKGGFGSRRHVETPVSDMSELSYKTFRKVKEDGTTLATGHLNWGESGLYNPENNSTAPVSFSFKRLGGKNILDVTQLIKSANGTVVKHRTFQDLRRETWIEAKTELPIAVLRSKDGAATIAYGFGLSGPHWDSRTETNYYNFKAIVKLQLPTGEILEAEGVYEEIGDRYLSQRRDDFVPQANVNYSSDPRAFMRSLP